MASSNLLHLDDYRARRQRRLDQALALSGADPDRSVILGHLRVALSLLDGDRAAVVWIDEYGPGLVHVHCLLDVGSDRPRREFSMELLRRAWEDGVPGLYDFPDLSREEVAAGPDAPRSGCSVALGSDGARAWFLVVDALTPRPSLPDPVAGGLMFVAGKCAAMVLHRDLAASTAVGGRDGADRFAGWPILRDVEGHEEDQGMASRISSRFLVTRLVRSLVEEDFAMDRDSIRYQVEGIRRELHTVPPTDPEREAWERVLATAEDPERADLAGAVLELANAVESQGHHHGAAELHRTAYEVAVASGSAGVAVDAARFQGRVYRRLTEWDQAFRWYEIAGDVARAVGDRGRYAVVLDGLGNTHRVRGNFHRAREIYVEALRLAEEADERPAQAAAHQNLMIVERNRKALDEALDHGWSAVQLYEDEQGRLGALQDLASVLVDLEALDAAEDAYTIVAARIRHRDYRIMALDGLAYVAALKGDRETFRKRAGALEELEWRETVSPDFAGQILFYRGLAHRALGELDEARRWLEEAIRFGEEHGLGREVIRADAALEELDAPEKVETTGKGRASGPPADPPLEVCEGLRKMRRDLVTASEAV